MKTHLLRGFVISLFGALALAPFVSSAGEIQYAHIEEIRGDTVSIQYKGPWGEAWFVCEVSNPDTDDCDQEDEVPSLYPPLAGLEVYPHNEAGTLAIRQFAFGTTVYYIVYDISGDKPKRSTLLPITKPLEKIYFADRGENVVLLEASGTLQLYNLKSKKLYPAVVTQSSRPFFSISPSGRYVAMYHWVEERHKIWDLTTGKMIGIPSEEGSYVEFSEDEEQIAYLIDREGFRTLVKADFDELTVSDAVIVSKKNVTVEDYLFASNELFFLANQKHPYTWSTWRVTSSGVQSIDDNASYGDYFKNVDGKLAYLTIDGKNTHVALFDPENDERTVLNLVNDSPASKEITRTVKKIDGRYGVLYTPEDPNGNLFIWLHGGPQRQTSLGYHSYLSYAVYDELMEKLAEAGNYVYKLDYLGSWGYGANFVNALHKQIGVADVADIENTIDELEDELNIRRNYLIGNSYGGYLAFKGIAELPREVDGAVSINGVSNWYSLASRIPSSPFVKLFEGVPDTTNMQAYRRAEVFTGLKEDVKDQPILVVYGTADNSVPTWQSTEYIEFAEGIGKNVETLVLEGEEHIIRKRDSLDRLCEAVVDHLDLRGVACD